MPGHFRRFIETQASPGLVIVSQELDIGRAIEELLLVWAASEAGDGFESCLGRPSSDAQQQIQTLAAA
jgi:hypothetical protein